MLDVRRESVRDARPLRDRRHGRRPGRAPAGSRRPHAGRSTASRTARSSRSATRSPTRRRSRALVLDSVLPHVDPQADDALYLTGLRATGRVLAPPAPTSRCGFDPADRARLGRPARRRAGVALLDAIVNYEFVDPTVPADDLDAIHSARHGAPRGAARRWSRRSIRPTSWLRPSCFSSGLHAATLCADMRFPWAARRPRSRDAAGAPRPAHEDRAGARRLAVHAGDRRRATASSQRAKIWPVTPAVPPPGGTRSSRRCRSCSSTATTTCRRRSHGLARRRASLRVASWWSCHGASHSVQTREQGDVGTHGGARRSCSAWPA